jgi:gliding motility-associated-like protein
VRLIFHHRFLLICFGTALLYFGVSAQKQANIWYFGNNAGLDFNSGSPVALTDGVIYDGHNHAEGSSVICDNSGKLLFYTNGSKVWNRKHKVMANGSNLLGHFSSSQSSLIVPKPGSNRYFYIFTTDAFINTLQNGLRYSIVDMCLDKGLGEVLPSDKNTLLVNPVAEKLSVVKHANGIDYWIIVHQYFTDAFYVFQLTPAGIISPVISHAGSVHENLCVPEAYGGTVNAMGWMALSPNGKKLAIVTGQSCNNIFELFDFDKNTGQVSNPVILSVNPLAEGIYGACFSPDNSKLYISTFLNDNSIYQFTVTAGSATSIANSKTVIVARDHISCFALQAGPDGKIYVAEDNSSFLSVINNPNAQGADCQFQNESFSLKGKKSSLGLPNFITNFEYSNGAFEPFNVSLGNDTILCSDAQLKLAPDLLYNNVKYRWQDSSTNSFYMVKKEGVYSVTVSSDGCTSTDNIRVTYADTPTVNLGNDTLFCPELMILLDAGTGFASYLWQDGSSAQTILAEGPGVCSVKVTDANGCMARDEIRLMTKPKPEIPLQHLIEICRPDMMLNAEHHFISYSITVTDSNFCSSTMEVSVENNCPGTLFVPNAFTPNDDMINDWFKAKALDILSIDMKIYDRWGALLFHTSEPDMGWNGKQGGGYAPADVYVYTITYTGNNRQTHTTTGNVTLLR